MNTMRSKTLVILSYCKKQSAKYLSQTHNGGQLMNTTRSQTLVILSYCKKQSAKNPSPTGRDDHKA
jgi:hypothetical protein